MSREALEKLQSKLVRVLRSRVPFWMRDRIDDLVQEGMVKLWKRLEREGWREGEPLPPASYVDRVAFSVMVDEIRRLRREREVVINDGDTESEHTARVVDATPEEQLIGGEIGRAIQGCLKRLIAPRRRAVLLWLMGYQVKEAADLLGWGAKRAENLTYRGLQGLRSCLEAKGVTP